MPKLRHLIAAIGLSVLGLACSPRPAAAGMLEDDLLDAVNFARTRPADYARELTREAATNDADPDSASFVYEDPDALAEAVAFLRRQPPLPPLRPDSRLAAAALAHASEQGPGGQMGHVGPHGETLGQRLQRQKVWAGLAAENISYGYRTPASILRQLIVDSGVPGRGHRRNIFGEGYQAAGVSCGRHARYGTMCVIDFAGAIVAR